MGAAISQKTVRDELEKIKEALDNNSLSSVIDQSNIDLNLLKNTTLDIGITGQAGSGKSALVNALLGMTDFDKGAAKTGIEETTVEIKDYPHPIFPKVTIWDFPGIGTPRFKLREYLQMVKFENFDFFMILASERFTESDVHLAHEIQKMQKRFYYVRTKMDISIDNESKRPNFCEEETLEKLRKHCCDKLRETGEPNPRVFLISRKDLNKYDFPLLEETLENDLDDLKRYALITTMPNLSKEILKKKKDVIEALIFKISLVSCGIGTVPVPGFSFVCDLGILIGAMKDICKVFDLDDDSLRRLASRVQKPVHELKSAIKKSEMANMITPEFVLFLLKKSFVGGLDVESLSRLAELIGAPLSVLISTAKKYSGVKTITAEFVMGILQKSAAFQKMAKAELVLKFIPMLDSLFGGISSFATTFYMLKTFLNNVEEDAENVLAKAAEPSDFHLNIHSERDPEALTMEMKHEI